MTSSLLYVCIPASMPFFFHPAFTVKEYSSLKGIHNNIEYWNTVTFGLIGQASANMFSYTVHFLTNIYDYTII